MSANYTAEQIRAYAAAVQARLVELGRPRRWLAEQLGISPQAMQDRLRTPGHPVKVYEVEDVLEMPGAVCQHLGYLRPGVEYEMIDCPGVIETILADGELDEQGRQAMVAMYRSLTSR